jgi:large subunit ribosomal protein L10
MPITREKKKEVLDGLKQLVKDAGSVVFVNFKGLRVSDATAIRRKLKSEGVNFLVAKKTLTKIALEDGKFEGTMPEMEGELGIVYGKDLLAPAREIYDFQKKLKDAVKILGGVFEKRYMSKAEMEGIATIPSQKTLHAMFVNIINSPIRGFAVAISEIAKKKESVNS